MAKYQIYRSSQIPSIGRNPQVRNGNSRFGAHGTYVDGMYIGVKYLSPSTFAFTFNGKESKVVLRHKKSVFSMTVALRKWRLYG